MLFKPSNKTAGLIVFFTLLIGLIFLFQSNWLMAALQGYQFKSNTVLSR